MLAEMTATLPAVLILQADPALRAVLASGLETDFTTLKAASADEALAMLASAEAAPDVAIVDASNCGADPFELARLLRLLPDAADLPVLLLAADAGRDFRRKALEYSINDFVVKPFDLSEVALRARNLSSIRKAQRIVAGYTEDLEARVAVRTAALKRALNELTATKDDLLGARAEAIQALGIACEYRDDDTASHIKRMAQYTRIIAERLDLDHGYTQLLESAAPLHDIGKIGVPDDILLKPGKLTPEEFRIMQRHPGIGARILSSANSPMLREAYNIALYHHEKWDGSGYPSRLAGEDIPLSARIVALSDVFDALTQQRVYKPAMTIEQSMEIINRGSGRHFDPAVVEAFKRGLDEATEICVKLRD